MLIVAQSVISFISFNSALVVLISEQVIARSQR